MSTAAAGLFRQYTPDSPSPRQHLSSIQYLRAIAASMVVYHHDRDRLPDFTAVLPSPIGQAGVDLFFVISGFIMVVTTWSRPTSPGAFMLRRAIRIVPAYWIYTTLLAFVIVAFPSALRLTVTPEHYLYSLLFIPHMSPFNQVAPLLQPGWTLNYEMFFHLAFAVALTSLAACRVMVVTLMLGEAQPGHRGPAVGPGLCRRLVRHVDCPGRAGLQAARATADASRSKNRQEPVDDRERLRFRTGDRIEDV